MIRAHTGERSLTLAVSPRQALAGMQRGIGVTAVLASTIAFAMVFSSFGSGTARATAGLPAEPAEVAQAAISIAAEQADDLHRVLAEPASRLEGETLLDLNRFPGALRAASVAVDGVAASLEGAGRGGEPTALDSIADAIAEDAAVMLTSAPGSVAHRDVRRGAADVLRTAHAELMRAAAAVQVWSDGVQDSRDAENLAIVDESLRLLVLQALASAVAVSTAAVGAWLVVTARPRDELEGLSGG